MSTARSVNDGVLEGRGGRGARIPRRRRACNAGEHSTRHHATNRAWRAALAAVAIGEVIIGDKKKAGE